MLVDQDWTPENGHPITNFRISCTAVVIVDKVMTIVFLQAGIIQSSLDHFAHFMRKQKSIYQQMGVFQKLNIATYSKFVHSRKLRQGVCVLYFISIKKITFSNLVTSLS